VATVEVGRVRRFNRLVTQRVGALQEAYLSRDRPLAEARLLWEVGEHGAEVRALRARLALDSGYLSRLLRSLEHAGLVEVRASDRDGRVRTVRLTAAGASEREELDRRSDALAASMLEPLTAGQRDRLLGAMDEVERLLLASMIEIAPEDPRTPAARWSIGEYFAELASRFDGGFEPVRARPVADADLDPPAGVLLLAFLLGEPVGCGGLRFDGNGAAEIKRMWVAGSVRGLGLGRRMLAELERWAAVGGAGQVRLDTNRALTEAIALYRSSGYVEVAPFNDEPYAHLWFEKALGPLDPPTMVGSMSQSEGSDRLGKSPGPGGGVPPKTGAGGQSGG
jgi:DNA-binding MarR family transcriptional regulator/GNAT superfamily N-acetyltransferase